MEYQLLLTAFQLSFGTSIITQSLLGEFEEEESPGLTIVTGLKQAFNSVGWILILLCSVFLYIFISYN